MDKDLKEKWVSALRSGKYRQGRYRLHLEDGSMCCLGVLCDVMGLEWGPVRTDNRGKCYPLAQDCWSTAGLPEHILATAGLSESNMEELAIRNDSGDKFEEIADYIEANL